MNQAALNLAPVPLYAAVVAACVCLEAFSASVSLAWDANSEPDIAGYTVYCTRLPGETKAIDAGTETSVTISNLFGGFSYTFYVTAYNSNGLESAPSVLVEYLTPELPILGDLGPVQITKIAMEGNALAITFPTTLGVMYVLEADDDFPSEYGILVESGIIGTGLPVTITDPLWNSAPRRVYRIAAMPSF